MKVITFEYQCGKAVSDNVYSGKVPDSANRSSQKHAGSSFLHCEALGIRPALNAHCKEQRWHPTISEVNLYQAT